MEEIKIDLKDEYMKLANAYSVQRSNEVKKENNRKDIELLLDVLGNHTTSKGYSEATTYDFIISDVIDRAIITKKLLSKIKLL